MIMMAPLSESSQNCLHLLQLGIKVNESVNANVNADVNGDVNPAVKVNGNDDDKVRRLPP